MQKIFQGFCLHLSVCLSGNVLFLENTSTPISIMTEKLEARFVNCNVNTEIEEKKYKS